MNEVIVTSPDNLRTVLGEVVEEKLIAFSHWVEAKMMQSDKLFTNKEAADYLGISKSTLYRWTKKGHIKAYGIEDRVYYKKAELDEAMIPINHCETQRLMS